MSGDKTIMSASNSAAKDTIVNDDSSTQTVETETALVDSNNSAELDPQSSAATQDTTDQLVGANVPEVVPTESEGLLEHSRDGATKPSVCRSTRVRQPPVLWKNSV